MPILPLRQQRGYIIVATVGGLCEKTGVDVTGERIPRGAYHTFGMKTARGSNGILNCILKVANISVNKGVVIWGLNYASEGPHPGPSLTAIAP